MRSSQAQAQSSTEFTFLCLDDLRLNGGTQPRAEINDQVVKDYAEAMERGEKLPPPVVFFDGKDYWLADGFHRVYAARETGASFILCEVRQGAWREAVLFSVGANATHGLRRTNADKRRAVQRLLDDEEEWGSWSNEKIAKACRVGPHLVAEMKSVTLRTQSDTSNIDTDRLRKRIDRWGNEGLMRTGGIGLRSPQDRETPEHLRPISEEEAKRQAVVERHRPIIRMVEEIILTRERLPSVEEATREFPKALKDFIDLKRIRATATWLTEFANALG